MIQDFVEFEHSLDAEFDINDGDKMKQHQNWLFIWNWRNGISSCIEFFSSFFRCLLCFFMFFSLEFRDDSCLLLFIIVWRNSLCIAEFVFNLTETQEHRAKVINKVTIEPKVELGRKL